MDNTYLNYFNYYLGQFLNELISYFPFTKQNILNNYRGLLEDTDSKSDLYVKYYMSKVNDYLLHIAKRDTSLFNKENLYLLEGVDFHKIWRSSELNQQNQAAIWKYLQLLVLLGRRIIPNRKDIMDMLQKVGGTIETPEKTETTLDSKQQEDLGEDNNGGGLSSLLNMAGGLGGLGNLLGGGGSGDGNAGLGGLGQMAQGLGDIMKNLNIEELAQNLSKGMAEDGEQSADGEQTADGEQSADGEQTTDGETAQQGGAATGLFNSGLFTDLAKEMTDTFDFSQQEQPQNIGDAFKSFMSGDNASKLMGLVGKFGNRLQKDIAKGNINQQQLLRETGQMMGGMGNLQQMAQQMGQQMGNSEGEEQPTAEMIQEAVAAMGGNQAAQNRVRNANRGQATRDRLRAKLEARKAGKK